MGISFVHEDVTDEELVEYITRVHQSIGEAISMKIFFTNNVQHLETVRKDRSRNKMIITRNISPEFITKAVDITDNIVYRGTNCEAVTARVKKILEKSRINAR